MDIRYSCNQRDFKRYTTEETRKEFLIEKLFTPDTVEAVYSHVDRMVTLGIMPVQEKVSIDKGIDIWHNFGTEYFLERRECGMFNVGGAGKVTVDGTVYELGYKDCLYITKGAKEVYFESEDAAKPAKFYLVSAPAHCSYENRLIQNRGRGEEALRRRGHQQQAGDQPVHPSLRAEDLPAEHGHDRAGKRQRLEHDAGPYP